MILVLCFLLLSVSGLRSQVSDVRNVVQPALSLALNEMQFDLVVKRTSDRWRFWANTTIRLRSPGLDTLTNGFDPAIHTLAFEPDSSDLPLVPYTPGAMTGYAVDYTMAGGAIVINVIGPDSVDDAIAIDPPDTVRIGRFIVTSPNPTDIIPKDLVFATPYDYYQADAFKLDHDSVTGSGVDRNIWFIKHDNPPMVAEYEELPPPPDICDAEFNFYGQYVGDLNVMLGFTVDDEHCYEGYIIERALVSRADPDNVDFQGRAQLHYLNEPRLVGCICLAPQTRDSLFDKVEYRREMYAYRLIGKRLPFYGDTLEIIDTIFIRIPNAVLSNARILENPFSDETTIRFNVDDRLRLTARCYDLGGRLIGNLEDENGEPIEDKEYPIGTDYRIKFKAPAVASQGLLNMVLVGVPVDDLSIAGQSRVIIKAQLLR